MVGAHHEQYAKFQVSRQIIEGGEDFLRAVGALAERYVGSVACGSLTETVLRTDDFGETQLRDRHTPFNESFIDVYPPGKLRMVLYDRRAPVNISNRFGFSRAKAYMDANNFKRCREVDKIASDAGFDPTRTPILVNTVIEMYTPGIGTELSLVPTPTPRHLGALMLGRQIKGIHDKLLEGRDTKKVAHPSAPAFPFAPFCRVSDDIDLVKYNGFYEKVLEQLEQPERLVMAQVRARAD